MNDKLPRMDYRQHRRARRLVHECCNYDGGNCLLLDDGEPCVCVQSISLSLMRPAQSGQYFPRFDLGTKAAPQTAHRFRLPRYKRAAASSPSRGRTATRNQRHMREKEMLWTHTQGSPSSNSRQFPSS